VRPVVTDVLSSVCLFFTTVSCTKRNEQIEEASVYTHWVLLCQREIWVSPKGYFLLGPLPQTPDLENFATASRSRCQQNSSSSTVELVDDTYTTIEESWQLTTSRSTVTLKLHYFDLLWICCIACFYNWQDFNWQRVARSVCGSKAFRAVGLIWLSCRPTCMSTDWKASALNVRNIYNTRNSSDVCFLS